MTEKKIILYCTVCGKKLIEKRVDGLFHFVFGAPRDEEGKVIGDPPVDILIHGNIKIRCIRRSCRAINTLNMFPFPIDQN